MTSKRVSNQGRHMSTNSSVKNNWRRSRINVKFIGLGKGHDKEAIWHILRTYNVGGMLVNCIKSLLC